MLYQLSKEANIGYLILKQKLAKSNILDKVRQITGNPEIKFYIEDSLTRISTQVAKSSLNFIFSIPSRLLDIVLTFFFTFFLLIDGKNIVKKIEKIIPLKKFQKKEIIKKINDVIYAIIYGFFLIAILEGIIAAVTLKLFGVASPLLWGIVIAFLTFIPFIGPIIVWIPAAIIQILHKHFFNTAGIVVGGLIITYIDTILKPKVIGDRAEINPAITLVGLLGGLKLMGIVGIIIGPIILALLITFIKMSVKNKNN